MAQVSHETGLLVQGDTAAEAVVNTDATWKAARNDAVSLLPIDRASIFHEYFVGGPGEQVDGAPVSVGLGDAGVRRQRAGAPSEQITIGGPRGDPRHARRAGSSCRAPSR